MDLLFPGFVFLAIVVLIAVKRPLYQALLGGIVTTAVLFRIDPVNIVRLTSQVFT